MTERKSNLELLRILCMCGIIFIHYVGADLGGAVVNGTFPNFSWFFVHFSTSFFVPLVNCFVLISGYFMISSRSFSLKKPLNILLICAFYGVISYIIALLAGARPHDGSILYALFPYFWGKRWFVETYIILILLAPFMNKLLRSLGHQNYLLLMSVQLTLFCVWYSLGLSAPLLDDGYGIINFLTLYMLGGYVRLYGAERKWLNLRKRCYGLIFVACSLVTFALSYFINPYGYAFITNIFGALAAFLFFLKWDLGSNHVINRISATSFDVYFVHSDINTSRLLIYHLLGAKFVTDTPWMLLHVLLVILAMWMLGFITYTLRKRLFAITVDRWLDRIRWITQCREI